MRRGYRLARWLLGSALAGAPLLAGAGWVDLSGEVKNGIGQPLCGMVLANGSYAFSCDPVGRYSLHVPTDQNGAVTLFTFVAGIAPFRTTITPGGNQVTQNVTLTYQDGVAPVLAAAVTGVSVKPGWTRIGGRITQPNGTPLCAMALANGQYMFTCGAETGRFDMEVPWDGKGEINLFGFADGWVPATATLTQTPVAGNPSFTGKSFQLLAANDLGMHCADQDYQVFSILPPYNVLHAQVIQKGVEPRLMTPADGVEVTYRAAPSNIEDPNHPGVLLTGDSLTTTSQNVNGVYKSNFWESPGGGLPAWGFATFDPLYPPGVLAFFPFLADVGLPSPDLEALYLGPDGVANSGDEYLTASQATMPSVVTVDPPFIDPQGTNLPQPFDRFVPDLPFFIGDHNHDGKADFPFGYLVQGFNRFTAEGLPILPVDDQGRENSYPLMRIEARDKANDQVLAATDVVVPVAAEADCQQCHASQPVCDHDTAHTLTCDDIANSRPGVAFIEDATQAPGETPQQRVVNAAKLNILRLHDAKHGTALEAARPVVCASCHYSPALDLAQLGPNDDNGKEQTRHVSMSRAMHAAHGRLPKSGNPMFAGLFPEMPPPGHANRINSAEILQESCYNCHPGKRTKCLRGAMGGAGVVCQDCHGQMTQVGEDFSENLPTTGSMDTTRRVPWANEPKCHSCHLGDVLQVQQLNTQGQLAGLNINATDSVGNPDGLRLRLAYKSADHSFGGGGTRLKSLEFANSRFASDQPLYRLSGSEGTGKGHGGLACTGCHGSPHAIWPNENPLANDNAAANDIQGHSGTIVECSACHTGSLGVTLNGPHGMHPVNDAAFIGGHEKLAEQNVNQCRTCHGMKGEGSVLSRTPVKRTLNSEGRTVIFDKGDAVGCGHCHSNPLGGVQVGGD